MAGGLVAAAALWLSAWALGRRLPAGGLAGAALGLGAISLLTLILGLCGILNPWPFRILLAFGALAGLKDLWDRRRTLQAVRIDGLGMLQGAGATLLILPMALGAAVMPLDYDALEYHLGAPAAYLREGRIRHLDDNAYAAFPENQEMLYLAGLAATGTHPGGAAAAKAINLACWILTAAALVGAGGRAGAWGALILLASPWVLLTGGWLVYNEPGLALFTTLSVLAVREGRTTLAGLLAGLALGTKYPAALFLILPLALFLRRKALPFLLSALAAASPWLLKNLLATGNPVFPLLGSLLGPQGWDHARWDAAHAPGGFDGDTLRAALARLGEGKLIAQALPVFLVFGWGKESPEKRLRLALLAWIVVGVGLWLLFTHRIDRFCLPLLPAFCLLIGFGIDAAGRLPWGRAAWMVPGAAVLLAAAGGWLQAAGGLPSLTKPWEEALVDQTRATRATYSAAAIREINRLPAGSRVLFIGEAETFYVRLDGAVRVTAPTVFDAKPFERGEDLKALGFTHLYVNEAELDRLQTTYGDGIHGYSRQLRATDNFYDRLEEAGTARRIWQEGEGRWRLLAL